MYILLEGIDRSGKSTQIKLLKREFPEAIFTQEPGATPLGQKIRQLLLHSNQKPAPLAEAFLFLADRNEHINKVIKPNLNNLIISDRGFISGIAYGVAKGLDEKMLLELNKTALEGIFPQKIVLLELSAQELQKRWESQKLDTIEKRGVEYLLEVQNIMKSLLKKLPTQTLVIDAALPPQIILKKIVQFIRS